VARTPSARTPRQRVLWNSKMAATMGLYHLPHEGGGGAAVGGQNMGRRSQRRPGGGGALPKRVRGVQPWDGRQQLRDALSTASQSTSLAVRGGSVKPGKRTSFVFSSSSACWKICTAWSAVKNVVLSSPRFCSAGPAPLAHAVGFWGSQLAGLWCPERGVAWYVLPEVGAHDAAEAASQLVARALGLGQFVSISAQVFIVPCVASSTLTVTKADCVRLIAAMTSTTRGTNLELAALV